MTNQPKSEPAAPQEDVDAREHESMQIDGLALYLRSCAGKWPDTTCVSVQSKIFRKAAAAIETLRRENRSETQLIDERDKAEEAVSEIYFRIIGVSPEWSNLFGFPQAIEEITDAFELVRATAKRAELAEGKLSAARDAGKS